MIWRSARGKVSKSADDTSPTVNCPALPRPISRARCAAASIRATLVRTSSRMASAAGVGAAPWRDRSKSRTPRSFSMRASAWLKASRRAQGVDEVLLPGEPELARRAERSAHGTPVDKATWKQISDTARAVGMTDARIGELAGVAAG